MRLTEIMHDLGGLVNSASVEGGFVTNAFVFTDSEADASAAAALIPEAFHGSGVPTPVMTVSPDEGDKEDLAHHAVAFVPYIKPSGDPSDPFDDWLYYRYATFLPTPKVAAYTAPGMIQEGTLKIITPIPGGVAFYPNMKGEVVLGHQISPSTADLTSTPVRIDIERLMHTMFAGNTGFGKSVAALRMCYEMAVHWGLRIVVMDFGFAWRTLLNAPGLEKRVDIRQLRPDGVRPLRWNPLQIGRYINAETQIKAFVDIFGTVAQLGQRQQQHRMMDAVRTVYLKAGVIVDDPKVRTDIMWGKVSAEEANFINASPGAILRELTVDQRQQLSVYRSKSIGLSDLYDVIEENIAALKSNDQLGRQVLEGILWRLKSLTDGSVGEQFACDSPGNETIAIENLGRPTEPDMPGGVVVLEGGKFLDNFSKAWLLGWAGWMIYSDMVARRERQMNMGESNLFMVFEEANIIFSGLDGSSDQEGGKGGPSVSEQYSNMFRDSRKYGSYFGVITQSPSLIPAGIRSSCNNMVIGFLTDPKDKDVVLSALAKSEKGFHDEPWRRFISDEGIGMVLGRFPYSFARELQMPFLFQPLILNVSEPSDAEIEAKLGRIVLKGLY